MRWLRLSWQWLGAGELSASGRILISKSEPENNEGKGQEGAVGGAMS